MKNTISEETSAEGRLKDKWHEAKIHKNATNDRGINTCYPTILICLCDNQLEYDP